MLIFYDKAYNMTFHQELKSICSIMPAWLLLVRGSSKEKLYQELGLESLQDKSNLQFWFRYRVYLTLPYPLSYI